MQNRPNRRFISLSRSVLGLAGVLFVSGLAAVPAPSAITQGVQAQFDRSLELVTVDADRADIGRVLRAVFSQMGGLHHVDLGHTATNGVTGNVTVHLRNASIDTFLKTVLDQVGGAFVAKGSIYIVRPAGSPDLVPSSRGDRNPGGNTGRPVVNPVVLGNQGTPVNPSVPEAFKKRIGLVVRDQAIGTVLSHLNIEAGVTLTLSREVPGNTRVSVRAGDEPLIDVLDKICRAARLKYNITGERSATISPISVVRPTSPGRDQYGRCRNCRYDLKDEWRFCPMCGARLDRR